MAEKRNFMNFKPFEVSILQGWYLTGGNSFCCATGRKKIGDFKIIEKFIWLGCR